MIFELCRFFRFSSKNAKPAANTDGFCNNEVPPNFHHPSRISSILVFNSYGKSVKFKIHLITFSYSFGKDTSRFRASHFKKEPLWSQKTSFSLILVSKFVDIRTLKAEYLSQASTLYLFLTLRKDLKMDKANNLSFSKRCPFTMCSAIFPVVKHASLAYNSCYILHT